MPTSYMTIARTKKIVMSQIEQAGPVGIPVARIGRHIASSLKRDELIVQRGDVYIAAQHK